MSAIKRIYKEAQDISEGAGIDSKNAVFSVSKNNENPFLWEGYIFGPEGSPYQGGIFKIVIEFPRNYPFKPPNLRFKTKIYHPNISESGAICLDILKNEWSPALSISKVLLSICSLLTDPNADDPLSPDVAAVYRSNRRLFEQKAKKWTAMYAQQP